MYCVSCIVYCVLCIVYRVLCIVYCVSCIGAGSGSSLGSDCNSWLWVSGLRHSLAGFEEQGKIKDEEDVARSIR